MTNYEQVRSAENVLRDDIQDAVILAKECGASPEVIIGQLHLAAIGVALSVFGVKEE